ncbi:MAG: hypothetical protein VXX53_00065, partial [Pseudomonadota bacterium]|nr:hypothetical protein [Pseudomonadota bacterium]
STPPPRPFSALAAVLLQTLNRILGLLSNSKKSSWDRACEKARTRAHAGHQNGNLSSHACPLCICLSQLKQQFIRSIAAPAHRGWPAGD